MDSTVNGVTAGENGEWISVSRSTEADDSKLNYSKIFWLTMPIKQLTLQKINRSVRLLGIFHTLPLSLQLAVKGEVLISEQLEA